MKIILIQDVPNLGEEGDICEVANGYGRNYLLPKKFAVLFSKQNSAIIESRREAIEKRKEDKRVTAQGLKERLESEEISITMPAGETGKLFGSVTNATIAEYLEKKGIEVERKRIEVPSHNIKLTGTYEVKVKLYDQQVAIVKVEIKGENQGAEAAIASDEPKKKAKKEKKKEAEESAEAADEAPADETPADEAPADEAPADETPADEAPADEAPADEAPADEAPAEEAPAEEAPADEAPADEAPADEAPAEEAPADEAPADEAEDQTEK